MDTRSLILPSSYNERAYVFDTTLRDGIQSPGASELMTTKKAVQIAQALADAQVDYLEIGFPGRLHSMRRVEAIAKEVTGATLCVLSFMDERSILNAHQSLWKANRSMVQLFIPTSEIHMEEKTHMKPDQVLRFVEKGVSFAVKIFGKGKVAFGAEDASRSDKDFLEEVYEVAVEAGARIITVPDTVGYAVPEEFGKLISRLHGKFGDGVMISVHCHNDLGLGVANTLAGLKNGARIFQG
ncbi:MAG: 2-isopropylmalate synthase, partial [Candidatus Pacebacteria bacterium]|nr:2-isopropylmalate synthase [Candidatus Paceibacterota bacterium]